METGGAQVRRGTLRIEPPRIVPARASDRHAAPRQGTVPWDHEPALLRRRSQLLPADQIEIELPDGSRPAGRCGSEPGRACGGWWQCCVDDRAAAWRARLARGGCDRHAPWLRRAGPPGSEVLQLDPFSGHLFVFRGRRGDLLKCLFWDTQGLVLYAKRLERGRFIWPQARDGVVSLTSAQLSMFA